MVVVEWDKPFTFKHLSSCGVCLARMLIHIPFDVMLHQVYGGYKPMRINQCVYMFCTYVCMFV
jgi:hypothetical protein